jgi:hypothetical protein
MLFDLHQAWLEACKRFEKDTKCVMESLSYECDDHQNRKKAHEQALNACYLGTRK